MFDLKQITFLTRITCSNASLMLVYLTMNLSTVQEKLIKSKEGVFTNTSLRSFKQ